jgi:uncharacterized protein (TIGR03067 family)
MRTALTMTLALNLLFAFGSAGLAENKEIERELARDQGTWQVLSLTVDGNPLAKEMVKDWRLTIKGNDWVLRKGEDLILGGKYKIVAVKGKIRHTIVTATKGTSREQRALGINQVQGDMRKGCLAKQGHDRPTAFSSAPGSGQILITYKRIRPRGKKR